MKLVAQVKLLASPEQKQVLLTTLKKANEACNRMSEHAWQNKCFKQFDLHKACYHNIREEFGLASQLIIRCNAKVADSYKLDKLTKRDFRPTGSIAYDSRILTFFTEESQISLWTVVGRMKIPFAAGEFQKEMLLTQKGECDLCFIGGEFYLMVVCDIAEAPQNEATEYIGVDLGIVQIASDSEGNQYSGESIRSLRRRMRKLKAGLQHTAKKHGYLLRSSSSGTNGLSQENRKYAFTSRDALLTKSRKVAAQTAEVLKTRARAPTAKDLGKQLHRADVAL